jgi:hypothetical protein
MVVLMVVAGWSRDFRPTKRGPRNAARFARVSGCTSEAATAALLFLSTAYRPSLELVAKAQIEEREEADDDNQGGPDTPQHLHRQLRHIRRGERVDRLVLRLE